MEFNPNDKIGNIIGHSPDNRTYLSSTTVASDCLVGIEIEMEGMKIPLRRGKPVPFNKYWKIVHDGSLRNGGVEFVLVNPLSGKDLVNSIVSLERKIKAQEMVPDFSDNTSVHVHLDVRDMTPVELRNLIILYIVFERALFNYAGPDRKDNIFCPSFDDSQGIIDLLSSQFKEEDDGMFGARLSEFQKYSSCNLLAVRDHGSLEFRQHAGEYRASKILRWVNILLSLHKYAKNNRIIPKNLPADVSEIGIEAFTKRVFGKYAPHLEYPDLEIGVLEGIRLAQDLIHYDDLEFKEYEKSDKRTDYFSKYLKKLGKEPPKKAVIEGDWAAIIFEGMEVDL